MFGDTVETCDEHLATAARLNVGHSSSHVLLDALAEGDMGGIDDISEEVDALGCGEDALVVFDG